MNRISNLTRVEYLNSPSYDTAISDSFKHHQTFLVLDLSSKKQIEQLKDDLVSVIDQARILRKKAMDERNAL